MIYFIFADNDKVNPTSKTLPLKACTMKAKSTVIDDDNSKQTPCSCWLYCMHVIVPAIETIFNLI